MTQATTDSDDGVFLRRIATGVALLALFGLMFWLLRTAGHGVLVIMAGLTVAVLIDGLVRWAPLSRPLALVVLLLLATGLLGGLSWWLGLAFVDQMEGVQERAVAAWPRVQEWLQGRAWGRQTLAELEQFKWAEQAGGRFGEVLFAAVGGIATLVLVPVFGVFFALSPKLYTGAVLHLVPKQRRSRVAEVFGHIGRALRSWFVGRFVSMSVVGLGTALGLWAVGVPMAAGLGIIAGVLSFVPNLGPLLAAIPGALVGLSQSPTTALWALGVYLGVQAIDNYVVTPLVDQRSVDVPPACQLGAQLVLGLIAGALGVFIATPLAIVVIVSIQCFYVQDVLGDPVDVLGQKKRDAPGWFARWRARRAKKRSQ